MSNDTCTAELDWASDLDHPQWVHRCALSGEHDGQDHECLDCGHRWAPGPWDGGELAVGINPYTGTVAVQPWASADDLATVPGILEECGPVLETATLPDGTVVHRVTPEPMPEWGDLVSIGVDPFAPVSPETDHETYLDLVCADPDATFEHVAELVDNDDLDDLEERLP